MIFKSSAVALVVSSVFAFTANATNLDNAQKALSVGDTSVSTIENNSENKSSFIQANINLGVYMIRLSEKSALDSSYASMGNDRSGIIAAIDLQQNQIIASLRGKDSNAILTRKARLTDNAIYVQTTHEAAEEMVNVTGVASVELLSETANYTSEDEFKKYPFLTVKDPGEAVTVAIVGNGVDYTHASLGGVGTTEAYNKAWSNRSNAWDGFPTDTVIGGMDFSADSEGLHSADYNPIEASYDPNVESGFIPSGTVLASQILSQAPDAKILAYKTYDWSSDYFYPILDFIVDPNQDGDISDRPDIVVFNSYGNGGFYVEDDTNGSGATREIALIRRLSASGSLVVVSAGKTYFNNYFNLAWRGAVPEALTVGSVKVTEDNIQLSEFTPAGPTRGTHQLKPEVVAPAENITGAVAGSGDEIGEFISHTTYAAAYAAGTVAKILAKYPDLSPLEAKALVANTAQIDGIKGGKTHNDEFDVDITTVAEVPFMGTGLVNGDNAVTADAVVWEKETYQPGLAFGFVEAASSAAVTKDVTIRNLTDEVQSYTLSTMTNGDKANNSAISFIYPEVINVPANHSVVFSVTMTVDASKLSSVGITASDDFTIDKITQENVNGYLVFDNKEEGSAQLKMSWQVFPKKSQRFTKSGRTEVWGLPYVDDNWQAGLDASMGGAVSDMITIENNTTTTKTLYSVPVMARQESIRVDKADGQGNFLKNIGASISSDASCAAGSKLTVAVQMFDKFDLPMAEHFDKAGHILTYFSIYKAAYVDSHNGDPLAIDGDGFRSDNDVLAYIEIAIDDNGMPQASYVDYDLEYEWWNPNGRIKQTTKGVDVSLGDDTFVANICVDELYHDDIQSVDHWNEDLGWQFSTDRDALPDFDGTMIRYNPTIMGRAYTEVIDHEGEYNYPQWTYTNCDSNGFDWMGNPYPEDYCIEVKESFLANHTGIAKYVEDAENNTVWKNKMVLLPSEKALVSVTTVHDCNPNLLRFEPFVAHEDCPVGVMLFEIGTDNTAFSSTTHGYDAGVKPGQSFNVYENSENGTVVGEIAAFSEHFYAEDVSRGDFYLVNALPGTPFSVSTDGTITVANADALDYERQQSFTLKVHADYENRDTQVVDLIVYVNNRNDIAPIATQELAEITGTVGENISASVSSSFSDSEGDGITFTANDLPSGLQMTRSGKIEGTLQSAGSYQVTITGSDGVNTTSANQVIKVALRTQALEPTPVDEESTNGGSTGLYFLLFAGLAFVQRQLSRQVRL